jgi:hypothetical protein
MKEPETQRVRSEQFVIDSFFFQISLDLMSMVNLLMLLLLKNKKQGEKKTLVLSFYHNLIVDEFR